MKKKIAIIVILVITLCAGGYYLYTQFTPHTITTPVGNITYPPAASNDEIIAMLTATPENNSVLPEEMLGVWFDLNTDITTTGSDAQDIYAEITDDFAFITNFDTNTLFIKPDVTGKTDGFLNYDGSAFDALTCVLSLAGEKEWVKVLVADDNLILRNDSPVFDNVKKILGSYEFDAVLISSSTLSQNGKLTTAAQIFKKELESSHPDVLLGCEMYSLTLSDKQWENEKAVLDDGKIDFVLINADCKTTDGNSFSQILGKWNNLAPTYPSVSFICKHRNDKVYSGVNGWDDYAEICYQYKDLWNFKNIEGSCFYKLKELKLRKASSQRLSSLIYDGASEVFEVQQMTINPTESKVLFAGQYDTSRGLFCNSRPVSVTNDKFSVEYNLNPGKNTYYFENAGQYYTYRIYDNKQIIISADKTVSDNTLYVNVVAPDSSNNYAVFGGECYEMKKADGQNIPSGYSAYSTGISLAKFSVSEAELDVVCLYSGLSATKSLGTVTVKDGNSSNKDDSPAFEPSVTPYSDNGLGTALMCEIINDATEQLGILDAYDTYDPDKSTLMSGTLDYVNQINLTEGGNLRYELRSGVAVYAENCMLINNAFVMPQNNISVFTVDDSDASKTDIVFDYDWLSPVTVTTGPNDYTTGYLDFSFNITNYSAQYVDIRFAYTDTISNTKMLNFGSKSAIASAEVIDSGEESTTLRLHLKEAGKFYGFTIKLDGNGRLCLSMKKHSDNSLSGKVVMIDAGHGGLSMTGTAVENQSICEAQVTLSIALKTRQILQSKGATVVLTRTNDTSLTLSDRVALCEKQNPDIFVSLHCDGTENKGEAGTHTFYFRPYSEPLAQAIHEQLVHHYTTYIYTDADRNKDIVNKKIKYYPFYVTRVDTCPSVLVELGFMSNAVESSVLIDDNCQYWLADAVSNGIANYFTYN